MILKFKDDYFIMVSQDSIIIDSENGFLPDGNHYLNQCQFIVN